MRRRPSPGTSLPNAKSRHGVIAVGALMQYDELFRVRLVPGLPRAIVALRVRRLRACPRKGRSSIRTPWNWVIRPLCLTADRPLATGRVWDALCSVDDLQSRPDVDPPRIAVIGTSSEGLDALFTAALENRIRSVLLDRTLGDLASLVASENYNLKLAFFVPGLLQRFHVPENYDGHCILSALAEPINAKGTALPLSRITDRYADAAKA